MDKFFIALYRFFEKKKALMYGLLILSSVVFVYFGSKVQYEVTCGINVSTGNIYVNNVSGGMSWRLQRLGWLPTSKRSYIRQAKRSTQAS